MFRQSLSWYLGLVRTCLGLAPSGVEIRDSWSSIWRQERGCFMGFMGLAGRARAWLGGAWY